MIYKILCAAFVVGLSLNLEACKKTSSVSATKDIGDDPTQSDDATAAPSDASGNTDNASQPQLGSCAQSALCWRTLPDDKYNSVILNSNGLLNNLTQDQCEASKATVAAQIVKYCQDTIKAEIDNRNANNPNTAVAFDYSQITYQWETPSAEWSANP